MNEHCDSPLCGLRLKRSRSGSGPSCSSRGVWRARAGSGPGVACRGVWGAAGTPSASPTRASAGRTNRQSTKGSARRVGFAVWAGPGLPLSAVHRPRRSDPHPVSPLSLSPHRRRAGSAHGARGSRAAAQPQESGARCRGGLSKAVHSAGVWARLRSPDSALSAGTPGPRGPVAHALASRPAATGFPVRARTRQRQTCCTWTKNRTRHACWSAL
eukprot:4499987-Prymnesium_polylepis.1